MIEIVDKSLGSYDDRTGINSAFFDDAIEKLAQKLTEQEDPLAVIKASYPRIYRMIVSMWGTRELHVKLTKMVALDTEGREGFERGVGEALLKIQQKHMDTNNFEPIWAIPDMKRDTW